MEIVSWQRFGAVIFDLDGIVTKTAKVHADAWKTMFNDFLARRAEAAGESHAPFDVRADYRRYVDGKPRYEGVESFLAARGIALPYGEPEDASDRDTVCGLGNRKNELFLEKIEHQGVEVYASTVELIRKLRASDIRTAVVSSSRNCAAILEAAGLSELFDARVDGVDAERQHLTGKPAPDIFLEAARQLGAEPGRAVVIEDAVAGVEAGRRGGFGCVIGVDRGGQADALRGRGADIVVSDLVELEIDGATERAALPSALGHLNEIAPSPGRRLAVFLDYDGTLTPIVARPNLAVLAEDMRETLERLARRCAVAVLSGRDLADVRDKVGIDGIHYAGSHGFDIAGPGETHPAYQQGTDYLADLEQAETALRRRLAGIRGCLVERKRFAVTIHFREVADDDVAAVRDIVTQVQQDHPRLRLAGGKKIHELQPDIDWDKGKALRWLLQAMGLDAPDVIPLYIGDDVTDEDAFRAVCERGVGILVAERPRESAARYRLRDPGEVRRFLEALTATLEASKA